MSAIRPVTPEFAHARIRVLAAELPALIEAEGIAACVLAEAEMDLQGAEACEWRGLRRGDTEPAVLAYQQARRAHQEAARAVVENRRRAGWLKRLLKRPEVKG